MRNECTDTDTQYSLFYSILYLSLSFFLFFVFSPQPSAQPPTTKPSPPQSTQVILAHPKVHPSLGLLGRPEPDCTGMGPKMGDCHQFKLCEKLDPQPAPGATPRDKRTCVGLRKHLVCTKLSKSSLLDDGSNPPSSQLGLYHDGLYFHWLSGNSYSK